MKKGLYKFATFFLLAITLVCVFSFNSSGTSYAASNSHSISALNNKAQTTVKPAAICTPVTRSYTYWWGVEYYYNKCAIDLVALGLLFIPGVNIAAAVLKAASFLSCDGSIYLDIPWSGGPGVARPTC